MKETGVIPAGYTSELYLKIEEMFSNMTRLIQRGLLTTVLYVVY